MAAMTVVVAILSGAVLAFAAGAARTSSAPDRYAASLGTTADGVISQDHGRSRIGEVAALPGAEAVQAATFVFGGVRKPGAEQPLDALVFVGSYAPMGARLVAGRDADPADDHQFVATRSFVDANHATLGDRFQLVTLTQEQSDKAGFSDEQPAGPTFDVTLVGIIDGPADADDPTTRVQPLAVFAPPLIDGTEVGVAVTIMAVWFRSGVDVPGFRTQVDSLPSSELFSLEPAVSVSASVRTAVQTQGRGLWLLAAVSALAGAAVVGQLIIRRVRLAPTERSRLSALGLTNNQLIGESLGRAAVPVLLGTVAGIGLAASVSGVFPTGFVRRMEPTPGARFEARVVLLGAALFVIAVLVGITVALLVRPRSDTARRPLPIIDRIAERAPSLSASTGFRFAFTRSERDAGSVRAAAIGLLVVVMLLVGSVTFGSSLRRVVSDRARYGENYDLLFGSGATTVSDELRAGVDGDADVASVVLLAPGLVHVGTSTLRLVGMDRVRGDLNPPILVGRAPAADDEIALGRLAAEDLHVGVGSQVTLDGDGPTQRFRVTGLAVVWSIGINDGIGQDGMVTMDGLRRIDPAAVASTVVGNLRPGAPAGSRERVLSDYGAADVGGEEVPVVIENLANVRNLPDVLAGVLGALAVLTVLHITVTSIRNRRRDLAVIRVLGANGRWVTSAAHWQATTFVALPVLLGALLGLIAGQVVFRAVIDRVGAVDQASFPLALVSLIVAGLLVLANLIAALPARTTRVMAPAMALRTVR